MTLDQDRDIFDVGALPMVLHDRLAFSPEEFVRRYDVIQAAMEREGLDALLPGRRKTRSHGHHPLDLRH